MGFDGSINPHKTDTTLQRSQFFLSLYIVIFSVQWNPFHLINDLYLIVLSLAVVPLPYLLSMNKPGVRSSHLEKEGNTLLCLQYRGSSVGPGWLDLRTLYTWPEWGRVKRQEAEEQAEAYVLTAQEMPLSQIPGGRLTWGSAARGLLAVEWCSLTAGGRRPWKTQVGAPFPDSGDWDADLVISCFLCKAGLQM